MSAVLDALAEFRAEADARLATRPPVAMAACGCCRASRPSDACCSSALIRAYETEAARNPPTARIFAHLDGSNPEEDRHMSRVAHHMRSSPWWLTVPRYESPAPVAGEMRSKTERGKRALIALAKFDADEIAAAIESMNERTRRSAVRALRGAP